MLSRLSSDLHSCIWLPITDHRATAVAPDEISIVSQPQDVVIQDGSVAAFEVFAVHPTDQLFFDWYYTDGGSLIAYSFNPTYRDQSFATNAQAIAQNGRQFICRIRRGSRDDADGEVYTRFATMTVIPQYNLGAELVVNGLGDDGVTAWLSVDDSAHTFDVVDGRFELVQSATYQMRYQMVNVEPGETYVFSGSIDRGAAAAFFQIRADSGAQIASGITSSGAFEFVAPDSRVQIRMHGGASIGGCSFDNISLRKVSTVSVLYEDEYVRVEGTLGEGNPLALVALNGTDFGANQLYGALSYKEQTVGQTMDPSLVDSSFTGGGGMVYDDGRGANKSTTVFENETRTSPHIPMPNVREFVYAISFRNFDNSTPWPGSTGWTTTPVPGEWPDDSFMKLGVVGQDPNSYTIHGTQQHLITSTFSGGAMAFGSNLTAITVHYWGSLETRVSHFGWNTILLSLKVGGSGGYSEDGSVNTIIVNEEFGFHKAASNGIIQSMDPDSGVIGDGYLWFVPYQWFDNAANKLAHVLSDLVHIQASAEVVVYMNANNLSSATKIVPQPFTSWASDRIDIEQMMQDIGWQETEPLYLARLDTNFNVIGNPIPLANGVSNTVRIFRFGPATLASLPPKFRTQNTAVPTTFHIANYKGATYLGYITCSTYNELKLYNATVDADNHSITTYNASGATIEVDGQSVVTPVDVNAWLDADDNVIHTITSDQELEYIGTRRTVASHRAYFDCKGWEYTHESAGEHMFWAADCVEIPNGDGTSQYRWYNTGAGADAVDADYGPNAQNVAGGGSNDNAAPYYEFTAETGALIDIQKV